MKTMVRMLPAIGRWRRVCVGTLAAAALLSAPLQATAAKTLRVALYAGTTHVFYKEALKPFMEEVEQRTNGEIKFNFFPNGQLGSAADSVRMLQTRIADLVFMALPYHAQELPATQAINLPWGWDEWTATNTFWRATHEPGMIKDEWDRAGLVPVIVYSNPAYEFHSTSTPLSGLESLKGLKMRSPGDLYVNLVKSIGAVPIEVRSTDQYEALQRGLISASIYTFSSWKSFSVQELLNHTTVGNKLITVSGLTVATTPQLLQSLTPEQRLILLDAGRKYSIAGQKAVLAEDERALKEYKQAGLKTYQWSDSDKKTMREHFKPVIQDWVRQASEAGIDGKALVRQVEAFRAQAEKAPQELPDYPVAAK